MESDVIFHKTRNEKIGMIIALLHPQMPVLAPLGHGKGQGFGFEEIQKLILRACVDQHRPIKANLLHLMAGVMRLPEALIIPQIAGELLLPPI